MSQFEAAENRAARIYEGSEKGTLSGQIFVATQGGENAKLGAVQVGLFARDAINVLVAGLKAFADAKIGQLQSDMATAVQAEMQANAVERQAKADESQADVVERVSGHLAAEQVRNLAKENGNRAREAANAAKAQYDDLVRQKNFYYSSPFYFGYLHNAIQTAETDAEGRFAIQVPQTGDFVIAVQAQRRVPNTTTERYYWLVPVSLGGQQQLTQNLSNNSLTITTGSSSLIHTQD